MCFEVSILLGSGGGALLSLGSNCSTNVDKNIHIISVVQHCISCRDLHTCCCCDIL